LALLISTALLHQRSEERNRLGIAVFFVAALVSRIDVTGHDSLDYFAAKHVPDVAGTGSTMPGVNRKTNLQYRLGSLHARYVSTPFLSRLLPNLSRRFSHGG